MQIHFDTALDGKTSAISLIALLTSLYGLQNECSAQVVLADATSLIRGEPNRDLATLAREDPAAAYTAMGGATPAKLDSAVLDPPIAPVTPAPPVSTQQAPAPPSPGSSAEVDVHGAIWDERIHASTRAKNQDGSWRTKRGVKPTDIAVVAAANATAAQPGSPAAPPPPAPAAEPPSDAHAGFTAIMRKITPAKQAGQVSDEQILAMVQACGLTNLAELFGRADLQPAFEAQLDAVLGA